MSNQEREYDPELIAEQELNNAYNTLNALFDWLQSDSKFGRTDEKKADFRQIAQDNVIKFFDAYRNLGGLNNDEYAGWAERVQQRAEELDIPVPKTEVEDEKQELAA